MVRDFRNIEQIFTKFWQKIKVTSFVNIMP